MLGDYHCISKAVASVEGRRPAVKKTAHQSFLSAGFLKKNLYIPVVEDLRKKHKRWGLSNKFIIKSIMKLRRK